jgi:hypothetical protein
MTPYAHIVVCGGVGKRFIGLTGPDTYESTVDDRQANEGTVVGARSFSTAFTQSFRSVIHYNNSVR